MTTHSFHSTAERDAWHDENVGEAVTYLDGSVPGVLLTRTDIVSTWLLRISVNPHVCETDDPESHEGPVEVWRIESAEYGESHMALCRYHAEEVRQDYDPPVSSVEPAFPKEVTP